MRDATSRTRRAWARIPGEIRTLISEESEIVGREVEGVGTPRQLRDRLADPTLAGRVADPLTPVLDRICAAVGRASVPLNPRTGHALVSASSSIGATLSTGLEAFAALGIEVPPAAVSAFAAAGTIGVVSGLIDFYVTAATITTELRTAGRYDPSLLRRALVDSYLQPGGTPGLAGPGGHQQGSAGPGGHQQGPAGPGGHQQGPAGAGPGPSVVSSGLWRQVAIAVLRRAATRWVPLAGIPASIAMSNRDLARARRRARELASG